MARRKRNMENDRLERMQGSDAHGDTRAGDEGVDDSALSRSHRDDMTSTPRHGDELGEGSSSEPSRSVETDRNEDVTAGNRMQSQRSQRTKGRANDERWDNAESFTGKGNQREGSARPEGTGYREGSNTDDSSSENPSA